MQPASYNRIIAWCLISNFFVIIGLGHGPCFLIMAEYFMARSPQDFVLKFSLRNFYNELLPAVVLLSAIAQLLIIIGVIVQAKIKVLLVLLGLVFAYTGLFYLCFDMLRGDSASAIGFITAVPFMILSGLVIRKFYLQKLEEPYDEDE